MHQVALLVCTCKYTRNRLGEDSGLAFIVLCVVALHQQCHATEHAHTHLPRHAPPPRLSERPILGAGDMPSEGVAACGCGGCCMLVRAGVGRGEVVVLLRVTSEG